MLLLSVRAGPPRKRLFTRHRYIRRGIRGTCHVDVYMKLREASDINHFRERFIAMETPTRRFLDKQHI